MMVDGLYHRRRSLCTRRHEQCLQYVNMNMLSKSCSLLWRLCNNGLSPLVLHGLGTTHSEPSFEKLLGTARKISVETPAVQAVFHTVWYLPGAEFEKTAFFDGFESNVWREDD